MPRTQHLLQWFVVIFLASIPSLVGLAVSPAAFDIDYQPGAHIQLQSRVWGVSNFSISFDDILKERATVESIEQSGEISIVTWSFVMPELPPGAYRPAIVFKEETPRGYGQNTKRTGSVALPAVATPVRFFNPYPNKFLQFSGFEWDQKVRRGDPLFFKVVLRSIGQETINQVRGQATINSPVGIYHVPFTEALNILPSQTVELLGEWLPPPEAPLGSYTVAGTLEYDGTPLSLSEYYWKYGDEVLVMTSFSPQSFYVGEIVPFQVVMRNYWSDSISFSAALQVFDEQGVLRAGTTSAVASAARFGEGGTNLYLDTKGWSAGEYRFEVTVYYLDKMIQQSFNGTAANPPSLEQPQAAEGSSPLTAFMIIAVIIIVLFLGLRFIIRKEKGDDEL